jgi:hypothetical protein
MGVIGMNIAGFWHPRENAWSSRGGSMGAKTRVDDAFWHPDDCSAVGGNAALGAKRQFSIAVYHP